jgi:hypothetical protein
MANCYSNNSARTSSRRIPVSGNCHNSCADSVVRNTELIVAYFHVKLIFFLI